MSMQFAGSVPPLFTVTFVPLVTLVPFVVFTVALGPNVGAAQVKGVVPFVKFTVLLKLVPTNSVVKSPVSL
jgi:hypothetical protein